MTGIKLCAAYYTDDKTIRVDLDALDKRGRKIGARVDTFVMTFKPTKSNYGYDCDPGSFFAFTTHALRNDVNYGPATRIAKFATEAKRDAAVAKYLTNARKRAAKAATK